MTKILMIDNYDSFTFNLVQGFRSLGAQVDVYRNDQMTIDEAVQCEKSHVVISPGPGAPEKAGISVELIRTLSGKLPILGVCLGHQSIVSAFGGTVSRAQRQMHGKTSSVKHDNDGVLANLDNPFVAGRYHSLTAIKEAMPDMLKITATTEHGEIMGVRHMRWPIEGVQFHPESILTPQGLLLMRNFIEQANDED